MLSLLFYGRKYRSFLVLSGGYLDAFIYLPTLNCSEIMLEQSIADLYRHTNWGLGAQ